MSFRPLIAIALLLLAIALPVRANEEYPDGGTVTFQELTDHTSAYYGKTMHVRGVLNQCTYANCQLCPDWNHFDKCVNVGGWAIGDESRLYRQLYRFSEAVFTVVVSPDPYSQPHPNVEIDCFSPARLCYSEIGLINAERLIARKPSPLVNVPSKKMPPPDDVTLRLAFQDYFTKAKAEIEPDSIRLFLLDEVTGAVCTRTKLPWGEETNALWPTKTADLLPNPANPYRCFAADRVDKDHPWEVTGLVDISDFPLGGIE